jgi:hypothetical protein
LSEYPLCRYSIFNDTTENTEALYVARKESAVEVIAEENNLFIPRQNTSNAEANNGGAIPPHPHVFMT